MGADFILYHKFKKDHKLNSSIGFAHQEYSILSDLKTDNIRLTKEFQNSLYYQSCDFYINFDYAFKDKTWDISFIQNNRFFMQNLIENTSLIKNVVLNSTKFSMVKYLFHKTSVSFSGQISSKPIDKRNLFRNNILISNRSFIKNDFTLDFETMQNYNAGLYYNDSYNSQFKGSVSAGYTKSNNTFDSRF